jgi:F-type H+-transporting ATPase subunit alpha
MSAGISARAQIGLAVEEVGTVIGLADGIAWVQGLPTAEVGEVLLGADGSRAWVFQLDERLLGSRVSMMVLPV